MLWYLIFHEAENLAGQANLQEAPMAGNPLTDDVSWAAQPFAWNDFSSYSAAAPPIHQQSLFDMVMASDRMAPEAWATTFGLDLSGGWDQSPESAMPDNMGADQ